VVAARVVFTVILVDLFVPPSGLPLEQNPKERSQPVAFGGCPGGDVE
jgi:hypothetical protein